MNTTIVKGRFRIEKADNDKRLAFGWASISLTEGGGELVDMVGDFIDPETLENAAYDFVLNSRDGGG
ncbi:XkdF-like putative serine protease domain-containing protein [Dialister succinatiphilus]|uniref:XkdF-like putative serine protease domain-containing protein n=1 Tax=Dialister succinatiphilus TaxID=487173 RepID=UPI002356E038|nr:XkdF-like putative serine protease domain-containing protein [Dialister succinatiphilus]